MDNPFVTWPQNQKHFSVTVIPVVFGKSSGSKYLFFTRIIIYFYITLNLWSCLLRDNHRENKPTSKAQILRKNKNLDIWILGSLNQLFPVGFEIEIKFSTK